MAKKNYTMSDLIKDGNNLLIELQKRQQMIQSIKLYFNYFSKDIKVDDKEINNLFSIKGHIFTEKMEKWIKEIEEKVSQKGFEEGFKQGIEQGKVLVIVKRMLKANIHIEQIIEISGLTFDEIEKIKKEIEL